ncbi:MAG: hypothetical protein AB7G25_14835 [Sphingomonadaceae bacterium]
MRNHPTFVACAALMLSSCSSGPPALPEDVVGSAATCAAVAASRARSAIEDPATPFTLEQQGQVIHYAMLAGAADPAFSRANANGVVTQMQSIAGRLDDEDWKALTPLCSTAFPAADLTHTVTLPEADEEAQMACYGLGEFMVRALGAYNETYRDAVVRYNGLLNKLDASVQEQMTKKDIGPDMHAERSAEKNKALATAAKLGPPVKTLDACIQRFPPDTEIKLPT